jgi:hypothetical protein
LTILANPYRFRLGADTVIGRFLGDEPSGVAVDFTTMTALIRDANAPLTQYFGDAASLLTYTAPPTKWICNAAGLLVSGNTVRIDHDPVTHVPLGVLCEGTRTNVVLWNRDLTNAVWVKTNMTAAKDQTGPDGVANSACSLLATAANATCLQSFTVVVNTRAESAYVKRLVGSGAVQMTMDNGTTWTAVTVTADWTRVSIPSQSIVNPVVGFRLVTSGDKIAVDFFQNEIGSFVTSPIGPVSGVQAGRAFDNISLPVASFPYNAAASTLFVAGVLRQLQASIAAGAAISDGGLQNRMTMVLSIASSTQSQAVVFSGNVSQANFTNMGAITLGTEVRLGLAAEANNFAAYSNSPNALVTDTAGVMPVGVTTFYMSGTHTFGESPNGWIRRVKYLPRRVSNTELQRMVS